MTLDYGEYLHARGFRGHVTLMGVRALSLVDQDGLREVHGFTYLDVQYCVTVRTEQSEPEVLRLLADADPEAGVAFCGTLDPEVTVGDSGEAFRRILGEVRVL